MIDKLTDRLRGIYSVGVNAEFGKRSFERFIPPISIEAANKIEELEERIAELAKREEELIEKIESVIEDHNWGWDGNCGIMRPIIEAIKELDK